MAEILTQHVITAEPKKAKHAGGAPKKLTREVTENILKLLSHGLTESEIAQVIKIDRATIYRAKKSREFCNLVLGAKETADQEVVKALYLRAIGYQHPETKVFCHDGEIIEHEVVKHYPPDVAAMTLWLINRQRAEWRKEIQKEENRPNTRPPMIRLFSKIDGKEAAAVQATGDQMNVLLGEDFVAEVQINHRQKALDGSNAKP